MYLYRLSAGVHESICQVPSTYLQLLFHNYVMSTVLYGALWTALITTRLYKIVKRIHKLSTSHLRNIHGPTKPDFWEPESYYCCGESHCYTGSVRIDTFFIEHEGRLDSP
jgi:hypothetical protein